MFSKKSTVLILVIGLLVLVMGQAVTAQDAQPTVGGTMVIALPNDPDTLDIHKSADGNAMAISWLMGATLVSRDSEAKYHPWLATSWEMAEDGMTWTFHLRDGVKFSNGKPLTAQDYAWTINRLLDPATAAPQAGRLRTVDHVEATDASTMVFHMKSPFPLLLEQLSSTGVVQPYDPDFVAQAGDQFGHTFMGVGPYTLLEWQTGDHVTLQRNPDFNWGPEFVKNQGAYYIDKIEFRVIPEPATVLAGLEAGEIDYASVDGRDVQGLQDGGLDDVLQTSAQGMFPALHMNHSKAPFDDLNVRQAFNLAVDRDSLVKVVLEGFGEPQYGYLSPNIAGYWAGTDTAGYHFDLEKAKSLMQDAGYTADSSGMLQKDGQALQVTLQCSSSFSTLCQVLQAQYKALGVDLVIQVLDDGILTNNAVSGDYTLTTTGYNASESDILYRWYHTSREGALNWSHAADPGLDEILDKTRSDLTNRDHWVEEAQRYLIENAYSVPLYMPSQFTAISKRVKGYIPNPANLATFYAFFNDAWISQ